MWFGRIPARRGLFIGQVAHVSAFILSLRTYKMNIAPFETFHPLLTPSVTPPFYLNSNLVRYTNRVREQFSIPTTQYQLTNNWNITKHSLRFIKFCAAPDNVFACKLHTGTQINPNQIEPKQIEPRYEKFPHNSSPSNQI